MLLLSRHSFREQVEIYTNQTIGVYEWVKVTNVANEEKLTVEPTATTVPKEKIPGKNKNNFKRWDYFSA